MTVTNNETIETYNLAVNKYIEESPQIVSGELKAWIDNNLSHLDDNARILEIGSGSGKDAAYFVSRGYTMELTDASQGFVDHLRTQGYVARKFNILKDEFESSYDMIFANAVFLHFTEQELASALSRVLASLREGGRLAFTLKVGDGEESTTRKLDAPRYFHYWQKEDIEEVLYLVGFSDVHVESGDDSRGTDKPDWLYIRAVR